MKANSGLRILAVIEGTKGVLVLLAGFGLLHLLHADAQHTAEELVRHFHLNPAHRLPRVFLDLAGHLNDSTLWLIALGGLVYAGLRLLEAIGLWGGKTWAQWLGAASGAIYIPIELYELAHGVTWPKMFLLTVNTACVAYLTLNLSRRHAARKFAGENLPRA